MTIYWNFSQYPATPHDPPHREMRFYAGGAIRATGAGRWASGYELQPLLVADGNTACGSVERVATFDAFDILRRFVARWIHKLDNAAQERVRAINDPVAAAGEIMKELRAADWMQAEQALQRSLRAALRRARRST